MSSDDRKCIENMICKIRVVYDDREEFPWLLMMGTVCWSKFRSPKPANWARRRMVKGIEAMADEL